MVNILDEIVAAKRDEVEVAKSKVPQEKLEAQARTYKAKRRPFRTIFEDGTGLIAEIKPKSPSKGELIGGDPMKIADVYAKSSADAISVLTDERYFGGSMELLRQVRAHVPQAILRKDFIIDEYQVLETLLSGADAFLLIADVLSVTELRNLLAMGTGVGLDYIVEVHDKVDIEKALFCGAELVGINNRDLKTLDISLETTKDLMQHLPATLPVLSESGIESAADVRTVRGWGVRGVLVGTSILQSDDPVAKIAELKNALKEDV